MTFRNNFSQGNIGDSSFARDSFIKGSFDTGNIGKGNVSLSNISQSGISRDRFRDIVNGIGVDESVDKLGKYLELALISKPVKAPAWEEE